MCLYIYLITIHQNHTLAQEQLAKSFFYVSLKAQLDIDILHI